MMAAKIPNLVVRVADDLSRDLVRFLDHAVQRMDERLYEFGLDALGVLRILKKEWREEERDEWNSERSEWNYFFVAVLLKLAVDYSGDAVKFGDIYSNIIRTGLAKEEKVIELNMQDVA